MDINDFVLTDDKAMVLVEYLLPGYNNQKSYVGVDRALKGQAIGKWKLVPRPDKRDKYETRMMTASGVPDALTRDDMLGKQTYETKSLKKKRIAWVEDSWVIGGAEISGQTMTRIGEECGFEIERVTGKTDTMLIGEILSGSDLIVLNNVWGFSQEQMAKILTAIERVPYVKYEHDHREIEHRRDISEKLFRGSVLNFFLSPIHMSNHMETFQIQGICLPLAIDVEIFRPVAGVERKMGTALVCNVRGWKTWKTLKEFIDSHPEIHFDILSKGELITGPNVTSIPMVPYEEMPKLYSAHEWLVHMLDGWGAGERVVFEAALCGCRVIANERVGHMSWGKDLTDVKGLREWLRAAPYLFWREVDRLTKQTEAKAA
jgi:hypothetical protein